MLPRLVAVIGKGGVLELQNDERLDASVALLQVGGRAHLEPGLPPLPSLKPVDFASSMQRTT